MPGDRAITRGIAPSYKMLNKYSRTMTPTGTPNNHKTIPFIVCLQLCVNALRSSNTNLSHPVRTNRV